MCMVKIDFDYYRVHLKLEDKLSLRIGRDGGIQNFELSGWNLPFLILNPVTCEVI